MCKQESGVEEGRDTGPTLVQDLEQSPVCRWSPVSILYWRRLRTRTRGPLGKCPAREREPERGLGVSGPTVHFPLVYPRSGRVSGSSDRGRPTSPRSRTRCSGPPASEDALRGRVGTLNERDEGCVSRRGGLVPVPQSPSQAHHTSSPRRGERASRRKSGTSVRPWQVEEVRIALGTGSVLVSDSPV